MTDADGFTVPAGEVWNFDPNVSTTVIVSANVIVNGTLQMRPANASVIHTLRFTGINEASFVGGGADPVASDVGLWVMGAGRLDAVGTPRVAWNRTGTDPTWLAGDEIRVAPTASGDYGTSGFATFTPGSPVPSAFGYSAEVMNLTRNVRIEGTPTGRTHVFIRSSVPQTIKYAVLQHMGPRKDGQKVLGRWPLHFHMMGDASRTSLVEGVVVRDAGSHAFVPHASHGVTFRNDIAYNVMEDAYWWDDDKFQFEHDSHNIVWEDNIAALVKPGGPGNVTLTGFNMGRGGGNIARRNVAVGVQGDYDNASGFKWSEQGSGLWVFENNIAHNNRRGGIFDWFNVPDPHTYTNFVAYRNGEYGINHGAYRNGAKFVGGRLVGNGFGGLRLQATSTSASQLEFRGITIEGGIFLSHHALSPGQPVLFIDSPITGIVKIDDNFQESTLVDFVRTGLEPSNFNIVQMQSGSRIRVQRADGTAFQITAAGVSTIPAFA